MMVCLHVKVVWRRSGGALQAARLPGPPSWLDGRICLSSDQLVLFGFQWY
jgi:hypothetical protein